MTKWAIVADLNRCVGCQTCTTACRHTNNTPPGVQYRKVLDMEVGSFPDVRRVFVPVGCMHCDNPPCRDVCPTTATTKRADGMVMIDYDICIGCGYCMVACPYQARYKVTKPTYAFKGQATENEEARFDPRLLGVAQKCTFCVDRIDYGLANGLEPGIDPEATPACVNSCLSKALTFGDTDNPDSNVSRLLKENKSFRMHEELGTGPNIHYLWEPEDQ
jgi:phenylacetyl-CoA:acceptor oxidoreductase subunit 1